jgi:hypothetical protein
MVSGQSERSEIFQRNTHARTEGGVAPLRGFPHPGYPPKPLIPKGQLPLPPPSGGLKIDLAAIQLKRSIMGTTESPENVERVCSVCLSDNLLRSVGIRRCARCMEPFCLHSASIYDAVCYCTYCFNDLTIERSVLTKTTEIRDEGTNILLRAYNRKAVRTTLGGADWLFEQRRINDMSDEELIVAIEYHRQDLNLLITEQDRRRAEKAHRLAAKRIQLAPTTKISVTEKETKQVTAPKAKNGASTKKLEQAQALIALLLNKMSPEDLAKRLGG